MKRTVCAAGLDIQVISQLNKVYICENLDCPDIVRSTNELFTRGLYSLFQERLIQTRAARCLHVGP